jgi:hypothetical protein
VKSSHRCEALARALGYRTYATLLHPASHGSDAPATAEAMPFTAYLAGHGFKVAPDHLFRAVASGALRLVHDHEPRLTAWGTGVGELKRKDDGRWETQRERAVRLREERQELLSDCSTTPFLLSLALVSHIPATKTIRPKPTSYRLKHIAENYHGAYPDGGKLGPPYVPNGLLIAAAIHAGFQYRVYRRDSGYDDLNVTFNMAKGVVDDLDCEIRPQGATAQDRERRRAVRGVSPWLR